MDGPPKWKTILHQTAPSTIPRRLRKRTPRVRESRQLINKIIKGERK
jgi:hypothetical protein